MRQRHDASTSSQQQQTVGPSLVITRPPRKPRSSKGKEKAYHEPMSYEVQAREYFRKFGEHVARNQVRRPTRIHM